MNYHYPDPSKACNWGIPIDRAVLQQLQRPLADIDISTCLEAETKDWCRQTFTGLGYDNAVSGTYREVDRLRPLKRFYLGLRDKIIQHIESGQQPILAYRKAPIGGISEFVSFAT